MRNFLIIFSLFLIALLVRLYHFNERVVYGPEQGLSLISAISNLDKPSLLGIPYLLRETSEGLRIFTSPVFGYMLVPLIVLFNRDPINITFFFVLVNVLTGTLVWYIASKMFNRNVATISAILFLFNARMVYHSMFIWTSNIMPLIGIVTLYLLHVYNKNHAKVNVLLLGLVLGLGFGIQYFYAVVVFVVGLYVLISSRQKIRDVIILTSGFLLAEMPTVIFDIKHNFYHARTLLSYFVEMVTTKGESQLSYYHFLFLYPIIFTFLGLLIWNLFKTKKLIIFLILSIYLVLNIFLSPLVNFKKPIGMPEGLNTIDIVRAGNIINTDNPHKSNVTVVGDFDNRGYTLRYLLTSIHMRNLESVENYKDLDSLYVLAYMGYNFANPDIWEISAFLPYHVTEIERVNQTWSVYKLTK